MKSRTLPSFWDTYLLLPESVKKAARKQFLHWRETPFHPSLHFECVNSAFCSGLAAHLEIAYCIAMAFDRIHIDPAVCNGKPTIRGLRFTVDFVLKLLGNGFTAEDITREYPELQLEDVYQAAKYGAWLASENGHSKLGSLSQELTR